MILIADSGSSKIDWRLLKGNGDVAQAQTKGFNPYYQPAEHFEQEIREGLLPQLKDPVDKVYYYGTGISSQKNVSIIRSALSVAFPGAGIEVNHDLLAAARALCGKEEGIACILGTGSSSCYYDGQVILDDLAGLGFILGDEGSGSFMGKRLLADLLLNNMPQKLQDQFMQRYPMSRSEILDHVYNGERPAKFLAGFSQFVFHHRQETYCYQLAYDSFCDFIDKSITRYPRHREVKTHFTGSIAFYFSDILRQAAVDRGITVQNILQSPIAGLTLYHQDELKKKV